MTNVVADLSNLIQMARASLPMQPPPQQAKQNQKTLKPGEQLVVRSAHPDKRHPIIVRWKRKKPKNDAQDAKKSCASVKPVNNGPAKKKRSADARRRELDVRPGKNVVRGKSRPHAKPKPQLKPKLPSDGSAAACVKRKWPRRPSADAHA